MTNNTGLTSSHPRCLDEGVLTLADEAFFPGLVLLYESIQNSYPVPLSCFDGGLSKHQKNWAAKYMPFCEILPLPEGPNIDKIFASFHGEVTNGRREAMLWICPFLIQASPYQRVLWLDSDLVVLDGLAKLFQKLDDGPLFTLENHAPDDTDNHPDLLKLLPIERHDHGEVPLINAGVSGWDIHRDASVLRDYAYPVLRACDDQAVREAISWHDQGCLIWAIQNAGLQHRVLKNTKWNLCAMHAKHDPDYSNPALLYTTLKTAYPAANIVHWNGFKLPDKLSGLLGSEVQQLDAFLQRQPGSAYAPPQLNSDVRIQLISHISSATNTTLVEQFIRYYQAQNVENFLIILHQTDATTKNVELLLQKYGITPVMYVNDYSARLKAERVRQLKKRYVEPDDWVVYADVDEFQVYPDVLSELLTQCQNMGYRMLSGSFVDRITRSGDLLEIQAGPSIWEQFPYCADVAVEITGAWNRKVCVARGDVELEYSGSHHRDYGCDNARAYQATDRDPENYPIKIEIHHFKWDASLALRLQNKLQCKGGDKDSLHGQSFIHEYHSLHTHLNEHGRLSLKHAWPAGVPPFSLSGKGSPNPKP